MSGVHMAASPREMYWELLENEPQRRRRARALRAIYALVDPKGWDARRHYPNDKMAEALAKVGAGDAR
jgi:hypothetical protein